MKTKKELKEEYKQIKFKMGVFRITNLVNGKIFIGSSTDLVAIWHAQKLQLDMGLHPNSELQHDWKHYGAANFEYAIAEELKPDDDPNRVIPRELKALEQLLIEEIKPFGDKGYHVKR